MAAADDALFDDDASSSASSAASAAAGAAAPPAAPPGPKAAAAGALVASRSHQRYSTVACQIVGWGVHMFLQMDGAVSEGGLCAFEGSSEAAWSWRPCT